MSNPVAINTGANWKNVNNWHWIEKDCTSWAHDRIRALFTTCPHLPDGFSITKVTKIEGDVSVNQRKGRVKQLFDLEINFEFKFNATEDGTGFVSEFTADYADQSDLNLKLSPTVEVRDSVCKAIGKIAEEFKAELFETHGKPLLLEANSGGNGGGSECSDSRSETSSITNTLTINPSTTATKPIVSPASSTNFKTCSIEDLVTFPCPPEQLYLMLTDSDRIRHWSRAPVTPQILLPQAPFTLFDGNICGKFLTLKSPSQIDMEWKLKSWAKPSIVTIEIKPSETGGAQLNIKQSGVPADESESTKNNWHNYYWNPIKRAFGVML